MKKILISGVVLMVILIAVFLVGTKSTFYTKDTPERDFSTPMSLYYVGEDQGLCANDKIESDDILVQYINTENNKTLVPPASYKLSQDEWITDRVSNGYIIKKIREKENEFYFEYTISGGTYSLARIYKCSVFKPMARFQLGMDNLPLKSDLGYFMIKDASVDEMKKFIESRVLKDDMRCGVRDRSIKLIGNIFTYKLDCEDFSAGDWNQEGTYTHYNLIYRIDTNTGALTVDRITTGSNAGPVTGSPI